MDPVQLPPAEIFRAYDIRGRVGDTLTAQTVEQVGLAFGSLAAEQGQQTILVARDGRLSGPELRDALVRGLQASGRDVIDIGDVPTPVLYYATKVIAESQSGICITGSHNPADYNGLKMVLAGEALYGEQISGLRQRLQDAQLTTGQGSYQRRDIDRQYLDAIVGGITLKRKLKVVIDAGNGIAGKLAPTLFRELGCDVIELFCAVDGTFPNHHPDPGKEANLVDIKAAVAKHTADVGLAFDGDGDRVGVVTPQGEVIWPDRLLMLFAREVLKQHAGGEVIFDVKCSRALPALVERCGGEATMWRTGHSLIKAKLKATGAPLAGEMSGHLFFADRWYGVDDGLYAGARLLEILSQGDTDLDTIFAALTTGITTPELQIETTEAEKFSLIDKLCAEVARFEGGRATTLDGLRVDYADGWGLVRASNTTPLLIARFEGDNAAALERIKQQFHRVLTDVAPGLSLPF